MLRTPPGWIVLSPVESSSVELRGARGQDTVHHLCLLPAWLNRLVCLSVSLALHLTFSPAGAKPFPCSPCPQRPVVPGQTLEPSHPITKGPRPVFPMLQAQCTPHHTVPHTRAGTYSPAPTSAPSLTLLGLDHLAPGFYELPMVTHAEETWAPHLPRPSHHNLPPSSLPDLPTSSLDL